MALGVAVVGAGMAGCGQAAAYRAATSRYGSDLPAVERVAAVAAPGHPYISNGLAVEVRPFAPSYLTLAT